MDACFTCSDVVRLCSPPTRDSGVSNAGQMLPKGRESPFASLVGAARKLNSDAPRAAIVLKRIPSALHQRPRILIELPSRTPLDDPS